jgi:hypothetical protein
LEHYMTGTIIIVALVVLAFLFSWRVGCDAPVEDSDDAKGFFDENDSDKD